MCGHCLRRVCVCVCVCEWSRIQRKPLSILHRNPNKQKADPLQLGPRVHSGNSTSLIFTSIRRVSPGNTHTNTCRLGRCNNGISLNLEDYISQPINDKYLDSGHINIKKKKHQTCSQPRHSEMQPPIQNEWGGFVASIHSSTSGQIAYLQHRPLPSLPSLLILPFICDVSFQHKTHIDANPDKHGCVFCGASKICRLAFVIFALKGIKRSRYRPLSCWDGFLFRLITVGTPGFHLERSSLFYTEMEANWVFSHEG